MSSPSSKVETITVPTSQTPKFNLSWGLMAIAMTIAVVTLALWQPPYPYPAKPLAERSLLDQVIYPIETNGELRLWQPVPALNSIAASSDGKYLLAVGDSGAAIYSENGGRDWRSLITGVEDDLTYSWISDDGKLGGAATPEGLMFEMRTTNSAWIKTEGTLSLKNPVFVPQQMSEKSNSTSALQYQYTSQFFINRSPAWPLGMPPGTQVTRSQTKDNASKSGDFQMMLIPPELPPECKHSWAIGGFGSIVKSKDCGQTWDLQASALPGSLSTVTFLSDGKHGWAAGYGGVLLRTTDGGDHWLPTPTGTRTTLTAITFLGNGNGWMVAEDGTLMSSSDFGLSWISKEVEPKKLAGTRCIYFKPDGLQGWATSDNEYLLSTVDAGSTWRNVPLASTALSASSPPPKLPESKCPSQGRHTEKQR